MVFPSAKIIDEKRDILLLMYLKYVNQIIFLIIVIDAQASTDITFSQFLNYN